MNVLEIIGELGVVGGGETFATSFSIAMSKKINLTTVILHDVIHPKFSNQLKNNDIIPIILRKKRGIDFSAAKRLREIIVKNKIDVIHTENDALLTSFLAVHRLKNKPYIFHTLHNPPMEEAMCWTRKTVYNYIFKRNYIFPVAISESLADQTKTFYHLSECSFINNGVDLSEFECTKKLEDRKYDCAVIARFSKQKNHSFLVDVFHEVVKKNQNFRAIMAGDGELLDETKEKIKKLGLENNIETPGMVSNPSQILNDAKIIVLGSFFEGNPLCLLEGLASGCVIISTNVGGIPNIVQNNENGFLFDVNDINSFVNKIDEILSNIQNYNETRIKNAYLSKQYSIEKTCDEYLKLFSSTK